MQQHSNLKKRLIAAGCGVLLLGAAAGSLALWNDAAKVAAGSVTAGELKIAAQPGTWQQPTLAAWVPGDANEYRTEVVLTVAGGSLESELGVDELSLTPTDQSNPSDVALASALDVKLTHGAVQGAGTLGALTAQHTYPVLPNNPAEKTVLTVPVTVTVALPTTVSEQVAQNGSVNLGDLAFTLQQVAHTPAP